MTPSSSRIPGPGWLLAALLVLTAAAYQAGLPGGFLLDDPHNITHNPSVAIATLDAASIKSVLYAAQESWPSRGLARLSFALDYLAAGGRFDAGAMKVTNIAIHLANGVLVYLLLVLALRARRGDGRAGAGDGAPVPVRWTAALAAGIWLLHPLQLTAVLYTVQRMTSLAAFFTLLALVIYCVGRRQLALRPRRALTLMALGVLGGTALGTLCKENAILTPVFALLVELWFFALPGRVTAPDRRRLAVFHGVVLALPGVLGLAVLILYADRLLEGYGFRDFTLAERLLTEARVLGHYLRWFALPLIRDLSLYHDDIALSRGLLSPWTTAAALAGWLAVPAIAVATFRRRPVPVFCLLWFLAGHVLESTVLPLEIAFEHRNYVPLVGLSLAPAWLAALVVHRGAASPRAAAALGGVVLLLLAFVTHTRAAIWSDSYTLSYFLARNHPQSYRAQLEHAKLLIVRRADAREVYENMARAVTHSSQPVLPLLEMIKVTMEFELRLEDPSSPALDPPPAPDPPPAMPTRIDAPLLLDVGYLRALRAVLVAELERRLREGPIGHETTRAFELLRECIIARQFNCIGFRDDAMRWLRMAMDNPRNIAATQAANQYSYAALLASQGRFEEAAAHAARAWELMPRDPGFGYYEAIYLMRDGRLDEAGAVVERMEAVHERDGLRADVVRAARGILDDASRLRDAHRATRGASAPVSLPAQ